MAAKQKPYRQRRPDLKAIGLNVDKEEHALIRRAVGLLPEWKSMAEFCREAAVNEAEKVVKAKG